MIAGNARRLRGDRSQDVIAAACRAWGLPWSQQVVAAIEAGSRQLDLDELILFARALASETATGEMQGGAVSDLLYGDGAVRLGSDWTASLVTVRKLLSSRADIDKGGPLRRANRSQVDPTAGLLAEQRAARRLGVDPATVARLAQQLWGRSLTEQRDHQVDAAAGHVVDAGSRQALRGRVTRQLTEELRSKIEANRLGEQARKGQ